MSTHRLTVNNNPEWIVPLAMSDVIWITYCWYWPDRTGLVHQLTRTQR